MALTAAQVQAAIIGRTGDVDATTGDPVVGGGGYLATVVASVWAEYADKAYVGPRLQELYCERDLLDRMVALIQHKFDFRDSDATFSRSQRVKTLLDRRTAVQNKIEAIETTAAANRAPAVGQMTTAAAVGPPYPFGVDASDPRYGGDPYTRRPWGYP